MKKKVGIVVFNGDLPLILRRNALKSYDGWGLITGKVEDGEDFADAAIRELEEEIGVKIKKKALIDPNITTNYTKIWEDQYEIKWFIVNIEELTLTLQLDEWSEYRLVDLETAYTMLKWSSEMNVLKAAVKFLDLNKLKK